MLLPACLMQANVAAEIESVSGAGLKTICKSFQHIPENTADGMCIGYVVGVLSMMDYIDVLCLPGESTHAQATLVVQKYLYDNPGKLHLDAEHLVIDALQEAFPCASDSME
jgi:hypothetical protein